MRWLWSGLVVACWAGSSAAEAPRFPEAYHGSYIEKGTFESLLRRVRVEVQRRRGIVISATEILEDQVMDTEDHHVVAFDEATGAFQVKAQFRPTAIDGRVWRALGTRGGDEVIGEF